MASGFTATVDTADFNDAVTRVSQCLPDRPLTP
jgi:hypothetical protein